MSHNRPRILIADDYDDTRVLLGKLLEDIGAACDDEGDGVTAMAAYQKAREEGRPYDLLILDAAMPRATGYEVANFVRTVACDMGTPVIIFTGSDGPLVRPHAMHVGATEVWYKPLDPDAFKSRVGELLRGVAGTLT